MVLVEEIGTYKVAYRGGRPVPNGSIWRAVIILRDTGGNKIGTAFFHLDPTSMPARSEQRPSGQVWVHYALEDFPHVLDLLRNESPIHLRYDDDPESMQGSITTTAEPVGEEEIP